MNQVARQNRARRLGGFAPEAKDDQTSLGLCPQGGGKAVDVAADAAAVGGVDDQSVGCDAVHDAGSLFRRGCVVTAGAAKVPDSGGAVARTFVPKLCGFPQAQHEALLQRARAAADPWDLARRFPGRWQRYCADHYRGDGDLAAAFGVSTRTARKWLAGAGCNGDKVAVAVQRHPDTAPIYLFERE